MFLIFLITKTPSEYLEKAFSKNILLFLTLSPTVNLEPSLLLYIYIPNIYWLYINRLYFNGSMIFTISSNLSISTFFDIEVIYLYILFFDKVLINLSAARDFHSLCIEHSLISLIYYKIHCLYILIFCLVCN